MKINIKIMYLDKKTLRDVILFLSKRGITIDEIKHGFTAEEIEFMKTVVKNREIDDE